MLTASWDKQVSEQRAQEPFPDRGLFRDPFLLHGVCRSRRVLGPPCRDFPGLSHGMVVKVSFFLWEMFLSGWFSGGFWLRQGWNGLVFRSGSPLGNG